MSAEHYPLGDIGVRKGDYTPRWLIWVLSLSLGSCQGSSAHHWGTEGSRILGSGSTGRDRTRGCRVSHCMSLPRWRHGGKCDMYQKYLYFHFLKRKTRIINHGNLICDWSTCCKIVFQILRCRLGSCLQSCCERVFLVQASSSPPCLTQVPKLRWCPWLL